jgi:hypothetical protein
MQLENKIQELKTEASRMELHWCDNREMLHYFRTLQADLDLIERLCNKESKFDYIALEDLINGLRDKDETLTDITVNFQIQPIRTERKEARIIAKMYKHLL